MQQATPKFKHLSATPSSFQQSTSMFPMSVTKSHQAVPAPPTKSTPLKMKPSPQPNYYHEIDSEFLDFNLWSPGLPESMLTPVSPPHNDRSTTAVTSPQASSSHTWKKSFQNIPKTTTVNTMEQQSDNTMPVKRKDSQILGKDSQPPKASDSNNLCSFFTAGSVRLVVVALI